MFWQMWFDTARSRNEPVPASATQRNCRPTVGGGAFAARSADRRDSHRRTRCSQAVPRRCGRQQSESDKGRRPSVGLRSRGDSRLEHERVADERKHRGEVRQREKAIGTAAGEAPREPCLHQRARRREQKIRQPDRRSEKSEDQKRRILAAERFPVRCRNDGQQQAARGQQQRVHSGLRSHGKASHDEVRVRITDEKRRLEEDETSGPYRGRSAEPRQDLLGDDGLDQEQQERAAEDPPER